ncbi:hypothetical protein WR25_09783 [Diploscapter pachys]|uniref:Uncharacterized protein n=1 Tax=Diploscapter pachys TaxID=2018661 RepID=A0A2A2M4W4_9BILA|nr:hypothetical protein WR25_09783 [Diploscapter pachys]
MPEPRASGTNRRVSQTSAMKPSGVVTSGSQCQDRPGDHRDPPPEAHAGRPARSQQRAQAVKRPAAGTRRRGRCVGHGQALADDGAQRNRWRRVNNPSTRARSRFAGPRWRCWTAARASA